MRSQPDFAIYEGALSDDFGLQVTGERVSTRMAADELSVTVETAWRTRDRKFWNAVADLIEDGRAAVTDELFISQSHRLMLASRDSADDDWRKVLARAAANVVATADFSEVEVERFTELVASYSPVHVTLLRYFDEPEIWLSAARNVRYRHRGVFVVGGYQQYLAASHKNYFANGTETARVTVQLQRDGLVKGDERRHEVYDAALVPCLLPAGKRLLEFLHPIPAERGRR